jgi:predicted nucleic acid-binding protein
VIVVDASVLVSALIADDEAGERMRLRLDAEDTVCAPEVIDLEVANAWRRELLAGRIGEDRSRLALDDLASLPLARMSHRPLMPRIVALAEALDVTLLTVDGRSTRAPSLRCEVELIQ